LPCHDVSRYAADIVLALQYLHERGIVHRDLKPDNLLVARNGHLKLTDFGLSHAGMLQISGISTNFNIASPSSSHNHQENTQLSSPTACTSTNSPLHSPHQLLDFVGTPDYLAPEILLGSGYGPLADLWSLGIVIFEFLFGAPPFTGESRDEIFHRILHDQIDWQSLPLQDLDVSNEVILQIAFMYIPLTFV
jgi:microtubule-associated serine/threonine kinase